jgi:hypothetical protein
MKRRNRLAVSAVIISVWLPGCSSTPKSTSQFTPKTPLAIQPGGSSTPIFRDIAREAGLNFRWGHGGKTPLTILETLGHGCAFLDYDQDGLLDIFLVGTPRCALFRNLGNSRFVNVSEQAGITASGEFFGAAVGDYDNDGYPDLYVTGYGKCVLYHNTGRGSFVEVTAGSGLEARGPYDVVTASAFVDLDNDGRLDLFAGRYIVFTPQSIQFCIYSGIKAGCGVKNYEADKPRVYRNLGGGRFKDATSAWGFNEAHGKCLGVAITPSNGGSGATLYATNDEAPGDLFVPHGARYDNVGVTSGTAFNRDGLTQGGMGADWGDYNNDGLSDLFVATFQSEPKSLYRNDGRGLYTEASGPLGIAPSTSQYVAWTAKFVDYDNDGWQDLFLTNGHTQDNVHLVEKGRSYRQPLQLFHNEHGSAFREANVEGGPAFAEPIAGRGAAFGDFDNDGRVDVLLVDEEGAPRLLHNEDKAANHWLGVRLIGKRCNRDAIGGRVIVSVKGRSFVRDMQLAGGYLSAHDPRVHIGLGQAEGPAAVTVRWPDGQTDVIAKVALDNYNTVTQKVSRPSVH